MTHARKESTISILCDDAIPLNIEYLVNSTLATTVSLLVPAPVADSLNMAVTATI